MWRVRGAKITTNIPVKFAKLSWKCKFETLTMEVHAVKVWWNQTKNHSTGYCTTNISYMNQQKLNEYEQNFNKQMKDKKKTFSVKKKKKEKKYHIYELKLSLNFLYMHLCISKLKNCYYTLSWGNMRLTRMKNSSYYVLSYIHSIIQFTDWEGRKKSWYQTEVIICTKINTLVIWGMRFYQDAVISKRLIKKN